MDSSAAQPTQTAQPQRSGLQRFVHQIVSLPANFWYANIMEMLERLAFFSVTAIRALFLVAAVAEHGLGLSYTQKGLILSIWAFLQCIIPMVSGGFADRYGYRKSLAVAFTINITGYTLMGFSRPITDWLGAHNVGGAGFWVFLLAACFAATGTAIFKPPVQGTIARATSEETSSMGWGLFYWVVNIGGAIAPMAAAILRREHDWSNVFFFAAGVTALNFLPAFLLYREPERVAPTNPHETQRDPFEVFVGSIMTILTDLRLVVFLLIFSCFWLMFMQLFDLLPNFVEEWVNTADVAPLFARLKPDWVLNGQVKPEIIVNIDSVSIVLLVIPISWLISRLHKIVAMIVGMTIAVVGFVAAGTSIGWICCLMIFVFAIGEMICSPTFNAYIGLIAPKDKKALYMGYSNIPFAIGWAVGNLIAGVAYDHLGSKANLAARYMRQELGVRTEFVARIPNDRTFESLAFLLKTGDTTALQTAIQALPAKPPAEEVTAAWKPLMERIAPADRVRATDLLWRSYHPQVVWYAIGAIGLLGTLGMILFYLKTPRAAPASG